MYDETGKTCPTKKKERKRSTNTKTFYNKLQNAKQSNLLWERCAFTCIYMSFSVINKRGDTCQVIMTDTPFFKEIKNLGNV